MTEVEEELYAAFPEIVVKRGASTRVRGTNNVCLAMRVTFGGGFLPPSCKLCAA